MTDYLNSIVKNVIEQLEVAQGIREEIIRVSRKIIQLSSQSIKHLHRDELKAAEDVIKDIELKIQTLRGLESKTKIFNPGTSFTAKQEFVEATLFLHFKNDKIFPTPEDLNVPIVAYLHGIADLVGELRRSSLDSLRKQNYDYAEKILQIMEELFFALSSIDFPDGLTSGLRRKADMARKIVERTRSDVTLAIIRKEQNLDIKNILDKNKEK